MHDGLWWSDLASLARHVITTVAIVSSRFHRRGPPTSGMYRPCTVTQSIAFLYTRLEPTRHDFRARLGLRLLVGMGPGTRYIGVLPVAS